MLQKIKVSQFGLLLENCDQFSDEHGSMTPLDVNQMLMTQGYESLLRTKIKSIFWSFSTKWCWRKKIVEFTIKEPKPSLV